MPRYLLVMVCVGGLWMGARVCPAQVAPPAAPATVTGVVVGPDGARLPGVAITVRAAGQAGSPRRADDRALGHVVSGEQGVYRVSGLPPGVYQLRGELQGFRGAEAGFAVAAGEVVSVDLRLALDSLSETVTVVGAAERGTLEPPRVRESGARDVGEALSAMAGVWKVRRGAIASDLVVRGYQGDNLTVLIDGARLYGACPNNMDHTAFHVDFAEVERIEVGKGPFDLRSQGGLGAAVNIVTRRPSAGFHFNPQISVGSFGYVNPAVTGSYGTARFAVLGGYSYRRASAYRDGSGRSFLQAANYRPAALDSPAFDVGTAWARLDAASEGGQAVSVNYSRQRAGEVAYPYLQMDAVYDHADRVNVGYDVKRAIGPVRSLSARFYATRVEHWMTDAKRLSSEGFAAGYSMGTRAKTDTIGGRVEAAVTGGTIGAEVYSRGWDAQTQLAMLRYQPQASIPDVRLTSAGAYAEFSRALGEAFRLELGGRVDRTTSDANAEKANRALYLAYHGTQATGATDTYPSGKARIVYGPTSALTITLGVGRTVRVADPQERYFALRRAGSDWVGNPLLRPVKNTGLEVSVAYRAGRLVANAALHRDALHDAIAVYQQVRVAQVAGVANAMARSYRNVDATVSGAEIEAVLPVTDRLFLAGDVSLVRGRQRVNREAGVNSRWMAEMPPARTRLALRYERPGPRRGGFAEVEAVYSSRQAHVDTDLHEMSTAAYGVINARAGGSVGRLRAVLGVSNLLDRTYVEHLSYQRDPFRSGVRVFEPGRTVYGNLALVF